MSHRKRPEGHKIKGVSRGNARGTEAGRKKRAFERRYGTSEDGGLAQLIIDALEKRETTRRE